MTELDLELVVIGICLRSQDAMADAIARGLTREHFAADIYADTFDAAYKAYASKRGFSLTLIASSMGTGADSLLRTFVDYVPRGEPTGAYVDALIAKRKSELLYGKILDLQSDLRERAPMAPFAPISEKVLGLLDVCHQGEERLRTMSAADAATRSLASAKARVETQRAGGSVAISSGIRLLDKSIVGFAPGKSYILGARTGVGKTTLALNVAITAAKAGHRVVYVTVEMEEEELADKAISQLQRIHFGRINDGRLTAAEILRFEDAASELAGLPLDFIKVNDATIEHVAFEIRRLVRLKQVNLVVVDYLQIIEAEGEKARRSSRDEMKIISKTIKSLAMQHRIAMLSLSQLSRLAPEFGPPGLIHLAESDHLGRDADAVMLLYQEKEGEYWLSVAKQRRGKQRRFPLKAELEYQLFSNASVREEAYD